MGEKEQKALERLKEIFTEVKGLLDEASLLTGEVPQPVGQMVSATIGLLDLLTELDAKDALGAKSDHSPDC